MNPFRAFFMVFGLVLLVLAGCSALQGMSAAVSGGTATPPPGTAPGSTSELLYVGGYAVAREALAWFLRWRAASAEKKAV